MEHLVSNLSHFSDVESILKIWWTWLFFYLNTSAIADIGINRYLSRSIDPLIQRNKIWICEYSV